MKKFICAIAMIGLMSSAAEARGMGGHGGGRGQHGYNQPAQVIIVKEHGYNHYRPRHIYRHRPVQHIYYSSGHNSSNVAAVAIGTIGAVAILSTVLR